jgi:hypothetical protein
MFMRFGEGGIAGRESDEDLGRVCHV